MAWEQIFIPKGKTQIFCNSRITGAAAMNIIVTHTPICSTLDIFPAYAPLAEYPVNVFAIDFSGTGRSGGREEDFSLDSIASDLDAVTDYIHARYSSSIHLYGSTGIGGIFAQYYACRSDKIKSFAQFACADYKNTAGIGFPYPAAKMLSRLFTLLPNFHVTVKPPRYSGYNCELDNSFYDMLIKREPDIFKCSTKVMKAMLECFVSPDSALRNGAQIPTLVFKTLHDRYFSREYFDSYYSSLSCKKKLIAIDDIHNSYYFRSEEFCKAVFDWFSEAA